MPHDKRRDAKGLRWPDMPQICQAPKDDNSGYCDRATGHGGMHSWELYRHIEFLERHSETALRLAGDSLKSLRIDIQGIHDLYGDNTMVRARSITEHFLRLIDREARELAAELGKVKHG